MSSIVERLQLQALHIRSVKEDLKTKLEALGIAGLPELPTFDVISQSLVSIDQEMKEIASAKQNLINAINGKGQSLPSNSTWAQMVTAINNIRAGYSRVYIRTGRYNLHNREYDYTIEGESAALDPLLAGMVLNIGSTHIFRTEYSSYDLRIEVHGR